MPVIFRYHCNECEHDFDLMLHPLDMQPYCTKCESKDVTKQVSTTKLKDTRPWARTGRRIY